ncbi:MAG: helix-turn-helix transcriptional regulator [Actinomycetota bacterium]
MSKPLPALDPLWTTEELARFLGVPVATVYMWRTKGQGPPAFRVGRYLRFRLSDVTAWLERQGDEAPNLSGSRVSVESRSDAVSR